MMLLLRGVLSGTRSCPLRCVGRDMSSAVRAPLRLCCGVQRRLLSSSATSRPNPAVSLIPETLATMEPTPAPEATRGSAAQALRKAGAQRMSLEERKRRRRALDNLNIPPFGAYVKAKDLDLSRKAITTLQLNIGLYCNQACNHCHVESSPKRIKEMMSREVADRCLDILRRSPQVKTLDLTGGAPELNSQFRYFVESATPLGVEVIDRCNLTVLEEPGQEDLAAFLARHKVHVVASLPCYDEKNVKIQRGSSVFQRSIAGLKQLNEQGYGQEGSGLELSLVYNPVGAFLPPPQDKLEAMYKEQLWERFGIKFTRLFALTNMPVKRFADALHRANKLEEYMSLLVNSFNPSSVEDIMCRSYLSVSWEGKLFDCDFNQQLDMAMGVNRKPSGLTIFDIESLDDLHKVPIRLDNHCFGCTAGSGSSCKGTVA